MCIKYTTFTSFNISIFFSEEHITLQTLKQKIQERELFSGSISSLWKILKNIGFKYKKDDPRRGLMELPHIAFKRVHFLHEYVKIKREGLYQFVFLDETWIFKDGTVGRSWQDSDKRSVRKTKIGGARYLNIIIFKFSIYFIGNTIFQFFLVALIFGIPFYFFFVGI